MQPRKKDDRPPAEILQDFNTRLAAAEHECGALESERRQYLAGLLDEYMTASVAHELAVPESSLLAWAGRAPHRAQDDAERELTAVIRERLNPKHYASQTEYVTCTNALIAAVAYIERIPCDCREGGEMVKPCYRCIVLGRSKDQKIDRGEPPTVQEVDPRG
jgi:hypothetical protein